MEETVRKRKPQEELDEEEKESTKNPNLRFLVKSPKEDVDNEADEIPNNDSLLSIACYSDDEDEEERPKVEENGHDEDEDDKDGDHATRARAQPARRQRLVEIRRDCPFFDTVNRQVPLFNILKKFDGETGTEVVRPCIARMRYRVTKLPKYLILHMHRFTKNNFFIEKNPTLVNFPAKNLELKDYKPLPTPNENERLRSKFDLIANIVHDGKPGEGYYRVFVQ